MGSGVAKIVKLRYQKAYNDYRLASYSSEFKLGNVIFSEIEHSSMASPKVIANCLTQDNYGRDGGRYVDYQAVYDCLVKVDDYMHNTRYHLNPLKTVAMPMIGAGLGGGEWSIIEALIEDAFKHFKPQVWRIDYD